MAERPSLRKRLTTSVSRTCSYRLRRFQLNAFCVSFVGVCGQANEKPGWNTKLNELGMRYPWEERGGYRAARKK